MIKKNLDIKKQIVIIGAGAAGILLRNIILIYFPNIKVTIIEKKEIYNEDYEDFFKKNSKYNHPNVFSNLFYYLFKRYFFKDYKSLKKKNFKYFFGINENITRINFFKNLISNNEINRENLVTGASSIKINCKLDKVVNVEFLDNKITKKIDCDYVFDCSASQNFFFKMNEDLKNLKNIVIIKNKILITLNIKFPKKEDENKIDDLINYKDITLSEKNYDLTIMKQYNFHTFTFVSSTKYMNKKKASEYLRNFLQKKNIYLYETQYSIQWIHKNNLYYETKENNILSNLIPVGDSFFKIDPSNGMGLTSILFQVIYIAKIIENFSIGNYFKFSKKLFLHLSAESKSKSKKNYYKYIFSTKIKKFIPFYYFLRSLYIGLNDKNNFKEFLSKL